MKDLETQLEELQDQNSELRDELTKIRVELDEQKNFVDNLSDELEENDIKTDNEEDCRRSLFFAVKELEEVETGQSSIADKLFDLRLRYCRFM